MVRIQNLVTKTVNCKLFSFQGNVFQGLEKAEEFSDSNQIAYSLNNIGDYYYKKALFSTALGYIFRANEIFEKIKARLSRLDDKTLNTLKKNSLSSDRCRDAQS